jgi:hypothetical protein
MRARLLALAAATTVVGFAIPSHAATVKPQITDPAGDANAINNEGEPTAPIPSQSTPADDSGADIRSVLFQTTFVKKGKKKVATGFTATMKLSAAPTPQTVYRVYANSPVCSGTSAIIRFVYEDSPALGGGDVECFGLTTSITYKGVVTTVKGSSITWKVPVSAMRAGTVLSGMYADTRADAVAITAPELDGTKTATKPFVVGR